VEGNGGGVSNGSVKFILLHSGKAVYNSGIMRKGEPITEVDSIVIGGILEMIVDDAGVGESGDHAVWADPKIIYFEVPPIVVAYDYQGERPEQSKEISSGLKELISNLPEIKMPLQEPEYDWLINNELAKAAVYRSG